MGQLTVDLSSRTQDLNEMKRSLTVSERSGITFPRYFTAKLEAGKTPYDEVAVGAADGLHRQRQRRRHLRAARRRSPGRLVADGDQHRRQQVFPRQDGLARARTQRRRNWSTAWSTRSPTGARESSYFKTAEDAENFRDELAHLMLTQKACFNSPVWFNVGVTAKRAATAGTTTRRRRQVRSSTRPIRARSARPASSISVQDSLESILDLAKTEGMLFKWGSGTGTNLSTLREEDAHSLGRRPRLRSAELHEGLRRLRRRDQVRRQDAPRGQDGDPERRSSGHREVHLVQGEGREEGPHADRRRLRFVARRRRLLAPIFFQNANNSVRVTDEFMQAVADDGDWWTKSRRSTASR